MKKILIINPKGGCGKTTLATNLASYYALWGVAIALIDYDPQQSSLEWLAQRSQQHGEIVGINGSIGRVSVPSEMKRVVMDAPARTSSAQLKKLFGLADKVLIPILPSPIDIRASSRFLAELKQESLLDKSKLGFVANRVRENTLVSGNLESYLSALDVPLISHLRDSQNYIRSVEGGYGVFEMPPYMVDKDIEQWRPIISWVEKS